MAVASGTAANTAVYGQPTYNGPADITSAGGLSPWGTMGQGGNVWEYIETASDGSNNIANEERLVRGGAWGNLSDILNASFSAASDPSRGDGSYAFGFRVASVPEPSTLSLLAIGLGGLAILRRRK
jgi:formylglycine-generating enzyme required for sulfatase activity